MTRPGGLLGGTYSARRSLAPVLTIHVTAALCREAGELAQRHGLRGYDRVRFPTIAWRVRRAVLFGRPGPAASTTDDEADRSYDQRPLAVVEHTGGFTRAARRARCRVRVTYARP